MLKIIKTLLPLAWMCLIFILSDIPYDSFPVETTNAQQILAHIFLYGVLAYLIILALAGWQKRNSVANWRLNFLAIAFCIFYGITDEYHQGYVMGRFVSLADLGFDAVGAVLGVSLYWLIDLPLLHPSSRNPAGLWMLKKLWRASRRRKPKLLLHICCAGCGAYVSQLLKQNFNVVLYFYNPNIYPESEYKKRMEEVKNIAKKFGLNLIVGEYNHKKWLELIKGHEHDLERGERCLICYQNRLETTADMAKEKQFNYFTTTLTVSPYKDAQAISRVGRELAKKYNVDPLTGTQDLRFLDKDFKKQDGFKKSVELSKELGLYRQNYCGCEFSYLDK
ncbi:epoxyqueuosine reductase QueH [Candidatus Parcubacteria bacterium]|nr:epoxyqueuosine reductase QueH [Candidatus Parcubacteria bacterium]